MSKRTINEAIVEVLKMEKMALSPKEIYNRIMKQNLYQFQSSSAESIVRSQLRKSCVNINLKLSSSNRQFEYIEPRLYKLV
jgi:hypothetical protein